jgi:hypothetical protein
LDTDKKIMILVRKVVFQSGNPISTTCFFIPEEFVGVGSLARLPSALARVFSASHEKALRGVPPRSPSNKFPPQTRGRLRLREGSDSTFCL